MDRPVHRLSAVGLRFPPWTRQ